MSTDEILCQILTCLITGCETMSSALIWCLCTLANIQIARERFARLFEQSLSIR
ncbi:hypothetical protein BDR03DRAFT_963888 [Suillus americanus]|nr:hypothetical protein BDR03DRAFT_963888 [Suillus americanus]